MKKQTVTMDFSFKDITRKEQKERQRGQECCKVKGRFDLYKIRALHMDWKKTARSKHQKQVDD